MEFTVISLNVWLGGILMPDIIDFLQHQKPDILALQEVMNSPDQSLPVQYRTYEFLQNNLNFPFSNFAPAFMNNSPVGKIVQGNAIFSTFPLTPGATIFFNEPYSENYVDIPENFATCPRILQTVRLSTNVGGIDIFNVHGVWDLDGDNVSQARKNMILKILEAMKNKSPLIVLGDTNAKTTNPVMREIEQQLYSVFGTNYRSTFNMRRKTNPGYASAAVDMMYVSSDIEVATKDIPDVDISDHLPIVAHLRIMNKHT